jgi:hypothetical protein
VALGAKHVKSLREGITEARARLKKQLEKMKKAGPLLPGLQSRITALNW